MPVWLRKVQEVLEDLTAIANAWSELLFECDRVANNKDCRRS
jgi:hypothetical protein